MFVGLLSSSFPLSLSFIPKDLKGKEIIGCCFCMVFELIILVFNLDIYICKLILPDNAKPNNFSVRTLSRCLREFLRNTSSENEVLVG